MTADETQQEEETNDFTHLTNTALGPVLLNFDADNPVTKKTAPKALFAGVGRTFNPKALFEFVELMIRTCVKIVPRKTLQ